MRRCPAEIEWYYSATNWIAYQVLALQGVPEARGIWYAACDPIAEIAMR